MRAEDIIQTLIRLITFLVAFGIILFLSAGVYAGFYTSFVPKPIHEGPVHFLFEPCQENNAKCGFLNASVSLSSRRSILMTNQDYILSLSLEMPESKLNRDLGMFVTCAKVSSKDGIIVRNACKSAMLKYKSEIIRIIELFFTWPAILTDYYGEKQFVHIQFLDNFQEDPMNPALAVEFEILSRHAEVYDAKFQIQAKFSGLRYLLYYFPINSAVIGLSFNTIFLVSILLLSWYGVLARQTTNDLIGQEVPVDPLDSGLRGELTT